MGRACGQSFVWRAAKAAMRRVLDTEIDNEKKPQTDLARGACRVRAFVQACNTVVGRPGWLSSYARFHISLQARK